MTAETAIMVAGGGVVGSAIADKLDTADDTLISLLRELVAEMRALSYYTAAQRERTLYPINLIPSRPLYSIAGNLRMEFLIVSGAPGDEMGLKQGTNNLFTWVNVSGDPIQIPAPLFLAGEISIIDITDSTATNWRATLFAHRDTNIGGHR